MIINKITVGFVVQVFDTEKKQFISQNFTASDQVDYETQEGDALSPLETESFGIGPRMGSKEPYLPFNMVQPVNVNCERCGTPLNAQDLCPNRACPFFDKDFENFEKGLDNLR